MAHGAIQTSTGTTIRLTNNNKKEAADEAAIQVDQTVKQKFDENWQDELSSLNDTFNIAECDPAFAYLLKTNQQARQNLLQAHGFGNSGEAQV